MKALVARAATRTCFGITMVNGVRLPRVMKIWAFTRREAEEKIAHGRRI